MKKDEKNRHRTTEIRKGYKHTDFGWIPETWEIKKIKDIAKLASGTTPLRSETKFHLNGTIPWVKTTDLNNSAIYETEEKVTEKALEETSLKIFPRGTVLVAMYGGFNQIGRTGILHIDATINQAITALLVNKEIIYPRYLLHWLNNNIGLWKRLAGSSRKDPNITSKDVGDFPFIEVPFEEQKAIADMLDIWDKAINKYQLLIENCQLRKKGLFQKLLTGKNRLPGFSKKWNYLPIKEFAEEISLRNNLNKELTVLSCTKYKGLIPSLEYFGKRLYSNDLTTYKIVPKNTFAYATNHIEEGSIGYQRNYLEALISPMYTVFKANNDINHEFLFRVLKSHNYIHEYKKRIEGSIDRRGGLRWEEFSKIKVPVPELPEQNSILNIIQAAEIEIKLLKEKLENLKEQKKGLMQKLLVGRVRVNF